MLCYIHNLVKKFIVKLRSDFLYDLKKNLNILAKSYTIVLILAFHFCPLRLVVKFG